jgi:hypothetical protein
MVPYKDLLTFAVDENNRRKISKEVKDAFLRENDVNVKRMN